jgi:YHS domain-containing protein
MMRFTPAIATALLLAACQQQTVEHRVPVEMQSLENSPGHTVPVEQIPQLAEEATILKTDTAGRTPSPPSPSSSRLPAQGAAAAEEVMQLPFAPLIAMDPVDGNKVSIRVGTPTTEYRDRIYYFGSEGNRKAFVAEPERYLKGQLARY